MGLLKSIGNIAGDLGQGVLGGLKPAMNLFGLGGATPATPATPDFLGAANAQGAQNAALVREQTAANRPDIATPWGSQTWQQDPAGKWSSEIKLDPAQQAALESQTALQTGRSDAALGMMGRVADQYGQPMDYSGLPERAGQLQGGEGVQREVDPGSVDWMQQGQDAAWNSQKAMLAQRRADTETQLANQGLARGSEAWNREMARLDSGEVAARNESFGAGLTAAESAARQALAKGTFRNAAQQQGFGQNLQAFGFNNTNRQDALSEAIGRRNQPLNEVNALIEGQQVQNPPMPNFTQAGAAQAPNQLGAMQAMYDAQLNSANAKNASQAGLMGGLFGLGSAAIGSGLFGG
ncbi:MAG: hypothetical protein ABL993_00925 [Vicinamibacterales bacterium]